MKKVLLIIFAIAAIVGITYALIPAMRDELQWQWVSNKNKTENYESYLNSWPSGRHVDEAEKRYDEGEWVDTGLANTIDAFNQYIQHHKKPVHLAEAKEHIDQLEWEEATKNNTIEAFERYEHLQPVGLHVAEAKSKIDVLYWEKATRADTIKSYRTYIANEPHGKFVAKAITEIASLRTDLIPYKAALQKGTAWALNDFLTNYPGHIKETEAKQVWKDIVEGRDIVDLLNERKIEVKATGEGMQSVKVSIRKLVSYPLTVRIPVGTYFISTDASSQNMVITKGESIQLDSGEWQSASPEAACANRERDVPSTSDHFSIQRSSHEAELARLMPVMDRAQVDTATRQAAVWIITDDADYDDLGILLVSYTGFGGSRAIHEEEAAHAMKICAEAGIDITAKRIWGDKQELLNGLKDSDLKKWLKSKK